MELRDLLIQVFEASGADEGLTYVSVPITTGIRELLLMRALGCSQQELREHHTEEWRRQVIQPNVWEARVYAARARSLHPEELVVEPARLYVPSWTQDDYAALWSHLISTYAVRMVVAPLWAFSQGARQEVLLAYGSVPISSLLGQPLTATEITKEDSVARERLAEQGWADEVLDEYLPRLRLRTSSRSPVAKTLSVHSARSISDALAWLLERRMEVSEQATGRDDARTRENLTDWYGDLEKRIERVRKAGLSTAQGRKAVEQLLVGACAFLESVVRVFGGLPTPGIPTVSLDQPEDLDPMSAIGEGCSVDESRGEVLAWLVGERGYQLERYPPPVDAQHVRRGFDVHWGPQLEKHLSHSRLRKPQTLAGRQALAKFVATATALLEAMVFVSGVGWPPARVRGVAPRTRKPRAKRTQS